MGDVISSLYTSSLTIAVAIFMVAAIESVAVLGLILPGTLMMSAVAFQAGQIEMNVYVMLASGALGAVAGDSISYRLGKTQCHAIPHYWPFNRHPAWLNRGQRFFKRHGAMSILIGRFVGPVRPLVPMVAGMMRMPHSRFLVVNVCSALGWAPLYLLPGYCVGRNAHFSSAASLRISGLLAILLAMGCLLLWGRSVLSPGRRIYCRAERCMTATRYRRRCWRALSGATNSFPLGSVALLSAALPCFIGWTLLVWSATPTPLGIDTATHDLVATLSEWPWLSSAARIASMIGDGPGLVALSVPWLLWWLWRRHYAAALHWTLGMACIPLINWGINWGLKRLLEHSHPATHFTSALSFAYPSAHTSGITLFCCMMVSYLMVSASTPLRNLCFWSGISLGTLVELSRLVCGVYWLSDIVGGALLGLLVHGMMMISYRAFASRNISGHGAWWPTIGMAACALLRVVLLPAH